MEPLSVTGFYGFGPASAGLRRNVLALVDRLREMGIPVEYSEVTVPALDFEEFEPFVIVDGREVYIPSVSVDVDTLVEYFIAVELSQLSPILPLPPLARPEPGLAL